MKAPACWADVGLLHWHGFTSGYGMQLMTGCSGFHYKEWKGWFYPDGMPQRLWLQHYATRFNTLELNNTFYRFPTAESLAKWHAQVPEDFAFVVKAPKLMTHLKKMAAVGQELEDFYTAVSAGLQEKAKCLLFQFAGSFHYSEAALALILDQCTGPFLHAFEFRHESWWRAEVYAALQEAGHVFVNVSLPGLPDVFVPDARCLYLRFHGKEVLYKSGYGSEGLAWWAAQVKAQPAATTFALFNNTWYGEAVRDAELWQGMPAQ